MSEPIVISGDDRRTWLDVAYTIVPMIHPQQGITGIVGKACGLRSDGLGVFALYALPAIYPQGFDWTPLAKARLDSFLSDFCSCSALAGTCTMHMHLTKTWSDDDRLRNTLRVEDIPSALRGHVGPPQSEPNARIIRPQ